jgi:hypothetical protein
MADLKAFPALCCTNLSFIQSFLHKPFRNRYASPRTNLPMLINLDPNLSQRYRLFCRDALDAEIGIAPAYNTRVKDNTHIQPPQCTFNNAYQLLWLPILTSKN